MTHMHHENVVVNTNIGIRFWHSVVTESGYVPLHWHSSIELVIVLRGGLRFTLNGRSYQLHRNQFIVIPSGIVHDVANEPNCAYVLQIPLSVIEPYVAHPELVSFHNGEANNPSYQKAVDLLKTFGRLQVTHPTNYLFDSQITFVQLLKVLFTELNNPAEQVPDDNNVKQIIVYINDHYAEKLSVAGLAHRFGYNANYLSRRFKEQVGISLINYIYLIKLNQLHNDLLNSDREISELFKKNGLTNPRTARKIFREMFGCLPSELRKNHSD